MATSRMSEATLTHFEDLLHAQRAELVHQLGNFDSSLGEVRESLGEGTNDDEHDPEGPTMSDEWSRLTGLHEETSAEVREIDAALARLAAGTYGVCKRCGLAIGRPRLEARPAAELCIECARAAEHR